MSTAARMSSPPTIPVLVGRIADLKRELRAADLTIAALVRGMTNALEASRVVQYSIDTGRVLACKESGEVRELRQVSIDRPGEAGYEWAWVSLPPVPGSPAAIMAETLAAAHASTIVDTPVASVVSGVAS